MSMNFGNRGQLGEETEQDEGEHRVIRMRNPCFEHGLGSDSIDELDIKTSVLMENYMSYYDERQDL